MTIYKRNSARFSTAFTILSEHKETLYSQATICKKLEAINKGVSTSLFNRMVTGKEVGRRSLQKVVEGLQEILQTELGMIYDEDQECFVEQRPPGWQKQIIPVAPQELPVSDDGPRFHFDGRRSIQEKTNFIANAQQEVIFLGVRLRQFTSYFIDRKDAEFKEYIIRLLNNGVHIKCYLANPDSNSTRFYFADRASVIPREKHGETLIPEVIKDLQQIRMELLSLIPKGIFQIYTYAHLPTTHFLSVDQGLSSGKMLVSNYTFGIPRSKVPVIEVHKKTNHRLFALYQKSLQLLTENAKDVSVSPN